MAGGRCIHGQVPFGGDLVGPNPTDRGKRGVKRSLLVEADGGPLAVVVAGANVYDTKLLAATLDAVVVERPAVSTQQPQHLCLDKGYDNPTGHQAVAEREYVPHIRRIGEEKAAKSREQKANVLFTGRKRNPLNLANGSGSLRNL